MRRLRLMISLLLGGIVSTAMAQTDPAPTPTPTVETVSPSVNHLRVRTSYTAFLRSEPVRDTGTDRAVIPNGTEVEVSGVVPDTGGMLGGYWYQVRALPEGAEPIDGWMHSTIVYLAPEQLAQLTAADTLPPPPTTEPAPSASSLPEATAAPTLVPTAAATIAVPLALRVCYDVHANKICDVDEGIAGVLVYAADASTGQILFAGATDTTGLARFTWQAPRDEPNTNLMVTVPYFQEVRDVTVSFPRVDPVVISTLAPIPAWLP